MVAPLICALPRWQTRAGPGLDLDHRAVGEGVAEKKRKLGVQHCLVHVLRCETVHARPKVCIFPELAEAGGKVGVEED
jgi:hypothetical protein